MTHHFVSLTVKIPALLRHLRKVAAHDLAHADEGALIKTALAETFGTGQWPKPFSVRDRSIDGSYEILAYTNRSPEELMSVYSPLPSMADAVPASAIRGYPLTAPAIGTELRFYIMLCPMIRTYGDRRRGIKARERDVHTIEIEKAVAEEREPRDRMAVYREFLTRRMLGCDLLFAQPMGFSFTKVHRGKEEGVHKFAVPSVTFSGMLRVTDQSAFLKTVTNGIGRQKTYGHGMILLGAAAPREIAA